MMTLPQAFNLALQHHQAGRLAHAEALYEQILTAQPNHSEALHMVGVIAHQTDRQERAIEWIQRAIAIAPNNAAAYSNLGEAYRASGRLAEAVACYRRALQLKPDFADAHNNLAIALWSAGQLDEAIAECRQALAIRPDYPEALYNLGNALRDQGQSDDAIAAFHQALKLRPNYQKVLNNLGNALWDQGRVDEAVAAYRRALECGPEDAGIHSNLIMALHYLPGDARKIIAAEQERWNRHFEKQLECSGHPIAIDRNAERKLRIGYVSPDLWNHVTGRNLLPLFHHHDHRNFEIVTYASVSRPDDTTGIFRRHSDQWVDVLFLKDEALAEKIRADRIDILVDLSLHGGGNRLPVFARRPAPVQVSFAGYPGSTGVEAIEYRISDRWLEGEEKMQDASRKSQDDSAPSSHPASCDLHPASGIYLLDSFWCYDPCGAEIDVNALPAKENGYVTFGSLNTFRKINETVLQLWAGILHQVADSHLLLLSTEGSHRQRPLEILRQAGVEGHRVEFVTPQPRQGYLELYHRMDVALDPFPYNGHTTTLDALWMGVPVVSLAGDTPVSRGGFGILGNLGLSELVAHSKDDYVRIAAELANDWKRLAQLRATLRGRMENSVLMNAPRFAAQIERAYRAMWQEWATNNA